METLIPHKQIPSLSGGMKASVDFEENGILGITFRWPSHWPILGVPKEEIRQPDQRRHWLWESTCLEAFFRPEGKSSYWEINLTPQGQWNAYSFDSYRLPEPNPPREAQGWALIGFSSETGLIRARFQTDLPTAVPVQVGLTGILETVDGEKSFWALKHNNPSAPDFHDAATFMLTRSFP